MRREYQNRKVFGEGDGPERRRGISYSYRQRRLRDFQELWKSKSKKLKIIFFLYKMIKLNFFISLLFNCDV